MRYQIGCAIAALFSLAVISACDATDNGAAPAVTEAVAVIHPTEGHTASGVLSLKQEEEHLHITGTVSGLTPGEHGFHVHAKGDCSGGTGANAGGHFNPFGTDHGGPTSAVRHVGDLGNISADTNGVAYVNITDAMATLNPGEANILGRAFIVHAGADDFVSQPSGAAGARVGCGVIGHR